jgi:hypothetical protein
MRNQKKLFVLGIGAALVALFTLTQTAASNQGPRHYQLGGSWIGKGDGTVWTSVQTPLEPQGKAVALRVKFATYSPEFAGLLSAFGADTLSDFIGHGGLVNRNTSQFTLVGYAQAQGNPPQICAILVGFGTFQFTDQDHAVLQYTIAVYPAAADADGDGLPDAGTTPAVTLPNITDTAQRAPMVQE